MLVFSHPMRRLATTAGGLALVLGTFSLPSLSNPPVTIGAGPVRTLFDVGVHTKVTPAQAAAAAATSSTFTHFEATVKAGPASYTYVMAGKNPAVRHTNAAATIKAKLVPVVIKANGDIWDPTKIDSCDAGSSPLTRVQQSPAVTNQAWSWGGTPIGTGQVTDAYQRADFWKYAQPGGINPGYGIGLAWTTLRPVTISVPAGDATPMPIGCGNGVFGEVDLSWLDSYLQSTVIPSLASHGVSPSTVPVFLLHNVAESIGSTCCDLGYHNSYTTASGIQTYVVAMYNNSGLAADAPDISTLSHEVAEWQDDPYGTNPTPYWGHIGQVKGCQSNLEVGDPLSGTTFTDTVGSFTYHVQELAFFSWFYHQSPSLGVNGWYSDQGNQTTFAPVCWDGTRAPLPGGAAANPGVLLHGAACPAQCVVGGKYNSSSDQGLLLAGSGDNWASVQSPLPSGGTNSPGVDQVACPSATACAAIGSYQDASGDTLGLLLTGSGPSWTATEAPLPPDAGPNPNVQLDSIACPSATVCAAVGSYISPGASHGLLLTMSGTTWTATETPTPSGATGPGSVTSVACPSTSECVVVGSYPYASGVNRPLILTGLGSSWSVTEPPLPPDAYAFGNSGLSSVACPSVTSCTAVGAYQDAAESPSVAQGLIETGLGTSWTATPAPEPGNAAAPAGLSRVACSSPSACLATGSYLDSAGNTLGWLATGAGTTWTALQAPVPSAAATNPGLSLNSATCQAECAAVGTYNDSSGQEQGILLTGTGTSWTATRAPMPADAGPGFVFLGSVACNPQLACEATGYYTDTSGNQQGWLVSGTG